MAFCTFYENYDPITRSFPALYVRQQVTFSNQDPFDFCYKNTSVLTKLRFKKKKPSSDGDDKSSGMVEQFDVTLYPNSVFIMALDMNRLYTHEICPSTLPISKLPIRMGYVIRCSKTQAVHMAKNGDDTNTGKTFISIPNTSSMSPSSPSSSSSSSSTTNETNILVELRSPTLEEMTFMRQMYATENLTTQFVHYGSISFTMNAGDLLAPIM